MHAKTLRGGEGRTGRNDKAQFTLDYVLSTMIVIALVFSTLLFIAGYKENMAGKYENATIKSITSDVSYTITSVYIAGHNSRIFPERNKSTMVASGSISLPAEINKKFYSTEVRSSEKLVCGFVGNVSGCANIIGVPSDFNITDVTGNDGKEIRVVYWRETDDSGVTQDYILVS